MVTQMYVLVARNALTALSLTSAGLARFHSRLTLFTRGGVSEFNRKSPLIELSKD